MADTEDINEEQAEPVAPKFNFTTAEEYLSPAEEAAQKEDFDTATAILREAAALYPGNATVNYDLGVAIFMKLKADLAHLEIWEDLAGQEELAEECFDAYQAAIEADPKMTAAYNNLGLLLALRGRKRKALEVLDQSLEINPDQPDIREEAGQIRQQISEE
ncbi:MAG: tetratricopeptide repeat protein [bacterium]|nr:tetratricopeptide repeat protein [Candidatus Sumerlaeota bacterium]